MRTLSAAQLMTRREEADSLHLAEVPVDPDRLAAALDDEPDDLEDDDTPSSSGPVNYTTRQVPYFGGTRTVVVISSRRS